MSRKAVRNTMASGVSEALLGQGARGLVSAHMLPVSCFIQGFGFKLSSANHADRCWQVSRPLLDYFHAAAPSVSSFKDVSFCFLAPVLVFIGSFRAF